MRQGKRGEGTNGKGRVHSWQRCLDEGASEWDDVGRWKRDYVIARHQHLVITSLFAMKLLKDVMKGGKGIQIR